jgi:ketosteroid isomerase-like protein
MHRLTALALLPLATAIAAAPPPADNREVLAVAQAFDDAQLHADRAALERLLAPDYLLVHGSGKVGGRDDFIAGFTDPHTHLEPFAITDRLFLRPDPDTAIVGGEARVRGTTDGRPFVQHFRYADIFARRAGAWQVVYTQVTPLP